MININSDGFTGILGVVVLEYSVFKFFNPVISGFVVDDGLSKVANVFKRRNRERVIEGSDKANFSLFLHVDSSVKFSVGIINVDREIGLIKEKSGCINTILVLFLGVEPSSKTNSFKTAYFFFGNISFNRMNGKKTRETNPSVQQQRWKRIQQAK